MRSESATGSELFSFDYFSCLRSDYAKNECSICIDLCPEGAMVFDRSRLTLDSKKCTGCAACIGGCPTEALASELFDPNRFAIEFPGRSGNMISCKESVPCLGALSVEHLITIAIRSESEIVCDLSHCKECPVNSNALVQKSIEKAIEEAQGFLDAAGIKKRISAVTEVSQSETDIGRRGLFKKLAGIASEIGEERTLGEIASRGDERVPLKRILLKNSLKNVSEDFEGTALSGPTFSFVADKKIDADTCTNCQECAMFCPTGALSLLQDNSGIIFQSGKCIACGICDDICRPGSIGTGAEIDIVDFAFDRMQLLVKHKLEICEECKVAFPYRGGEMLCDRCRDFRENFSDIFTLAKDLQ